MDFQGTYEDLLRSNSRILDSDEAKEPDAIEYKTESYEGKTEYTVVIAMKYQKTYIFQFIQLNRIFFSHEFMTRPFRTQISVNL